MIQDVDQDEAIEALKAVLRGWSHADHTLTELIKHQTNPKHKVDFHLPLEKQFTLTSLQAEANKLGLDQAIEIFNSVLSEFFFKQNIIAQLVKQPPQPKPTLWQKIINIVRFHARK
jgi:ferritin-like metal-binding protein YciE